MHQGRWSVLYDRPHLFKDQQLEVIFAIFWTRLLQSYSKAFTVHNPGECDSKVSNDN